jgi:hypothetical protein
MTTSLGHDAVTVVGHSLGASLHGLGGLGQLGLDRGGGEIVVDRRSLRPTY